MDLASHRSLPEVSAVQQLPELWAAYDNRCLIRGLVGWLPWKQMLKTLPPTTCSLYPCSSTLFLHFVPPLACSDFWLFFCPTRLSLSFVHFVVYCIFLVPCHTWFFVSVLPLNSPTCLYHSPQLHPQWELFLLREFCGKVTRSASPAPSLGTLCKSVCACDKLFCAGVINQQFVLSLSYLDQNIKTRNFVP